MIAISKLRNRLVDACAIGDAEKATRILEQSPSLANTATLDIPGWSSVLHEAAENGHLKVCEALVRFGADVNWPAAASGYITPLVSAAEAGHIDIVRFLIRSGAQVDGIDETSASPLIAAVDFGHHEIAEYLLEHGADANRIDRIRRHYALDFAIRNDDRRTAKIIERAGGAGTQSAVNFKSRPGFPVISQVSNFVGSVYPAPFVRRCNHDEVIFHTALIKDSKRALIMLFSSGIYLHGQPIDINLILPAHWPILQKYLVQPSVNSFPIDFLSKIAVVAGSKTPVVHGTVVRSTDQMMNDLTWPSQFSGMAAIDYAWPSRSGVRKDVSASRLDEITILTFVPILSSAKSSKSENIGTPWCDKRRFSTWKRNSLPDWATLD